MEQNLADIAPFSVSRPFTDASGRLTREARAWVAAAEAATTTVNNGEVVVTVVTIESGVSIPAPTIMQGPV